MSSLARLRLGLRRRPALAGTGAALLFVGALAVLRHGGDHPRAAGAQGMTLLGTSSGSSSMCYPYVKPIPMVEDRDKIGAMLEEEGMFVGLELGVQDGFFAATTLSQWK